MKFDSFFWFEDEHLFCSSEKSLVKKKHQTHVHFGRFHPFRLVSGKKCAIWVFPKMMVPRNHPLKNRVSHYKPIHFGVFPPFKETPNTNPQDDRMIISNRSGQESSDCALRLQCCPDTHEPNCRKILKMPGAYDAHKNGGEDFSNKKYEVIGVVTEGRFLKPSNRNSGI